MSQARRTWNAGDIPTANDFNNCVRDSSMYGVGASIVNVPTFTNGGGFLVQAGQVISTTNASGGFGFNFPTPFPNGVLSVMVMMADGSSTQIGVVCGIWPQTNLSSWNGICGTLAGGPVNTGTVRLNFIAVGW